MITNSITHYHLIFFITKSNPSLKMTEKKKEKPTEKKVWKYEKSQRRNTNKLPDGIFYY
jgi:hypothetical protein